MVDVVICGASRTPIGGFKGNFDGIPAAELGGAAIKSALCNSLVSQVEEVIMGNVLSAGQGQAPARQAGFAAGLNQSVPATTVNKMCGSGMKTTMIGFDQIAMGQSNLLAVGGMESMSNAPFILPKMRDGIRLGHSEVKDHMFLDGLEDAYEKGSLMGRFAEDCAERYQFTREAQDEYALASLANALAAEKNGAFKNEIASFEVTSRNDRVLITQDEQPFKARPEKIPQLKPAFRKYGTVTPANSSSISDGAAALILSSKEYAIKKGLSVRATIIGHASHAHEPNWFATAPIPAVIKLLDRIDWCKEDVELWEVNEAFAVVPMAFIHDMDIPRDRVNIHGGACALGHPIGASGARIIVTLLNAMELYDLKKGIAAICSGGGEGNAIAIERH